MIKSQNYPLGKNKFYNIQRGKKDNHFFFILPSIIISPKKFLHWDVMMFSIFIAWGSFFVQFNIFEIVKDTNTEVFKENMANLLSILKSSGYTIADMQAALDYLNKNTYLIQVIKNANLEHPYIKNLILSFFQSQPFIKSLK